MFGKKIVKIIISCIYDPEISLKTIKNIVLILQAY
jgi:hypothetical protein